MARRQNPAGVPADVAKTGEMYRDIAAEIARGMAERASRMRRDGVASGDFVGRPAFYAETARLVREVLALRLADEASHHRMSDPKRTSHFKFAKAGVVSLNFVKLRAILERFAAAFETWIGAVEAFEARPEVRQERRLHPIGDPALVSEGLGMIDDGQTKVAAGHADGKEWIMAQGATEMEIGVIDLLRGGGMGRVADALHFLLFQGGSIHPASVEKLARAAVRSAKGRVR